MDKEHSGLAADYHNRLDDNSELLAPIGIDLMRENGMDDILKASGLIE
ncbi:MAG: hypothetical protein LBN26_02680 [Christensenellaceae bacterium]|jgi:hypothetical protein|nr:hypothetical protein [Christensenellaceae bacterium]